MPYAEELEKEKEGDTSIGVQSLTAHDDKSSLADNIPGKEITYLIFYLFVASKRRPFLHLYLLISMSLFSCLKVDSDWQES